MKIVFIRNEMSLKDQYKMASIYPSIFIASLLFLFIVYVLAVGINSHGIEALAPLSIVAAYSFVYIIYGLAITIFTIFIVLLNKFSFFRDNKILHFLTFYTTPMANFFFLYYILGFTGLVVLYILPYFIGATLAYKNIYFWFKRKEDRN